MSIPGSAGPPRRVRVVLADRRPAPAPVSARSEVDDHTEIGRLLVRGLIRTQLALAVRVAVMAMLLIGSWPLIFAFVPSIAQARPAGIGLPWLILGLWAPCVAYVLARYYARRAAVHEAEFTELLQ